ncbi:MAG: N-acetylmuramoyl-L-alanine amidase [Lachnospiraceae bacterium]|nr:N-acetylmuramoyl-L-alanine amidase [Lachnospiraceae bacterium]
MINLLLDAGHGDPPITGGKCSPDKTILEYYWARDMVERIARKAKDAGIPVHIIVPEKSDIPLKTRTNRVNDLCRKLGASNCVLLSIHINAAAGTGWHNARGWSGWVAPNASKNSKRLARILWEQANKAGLRGNRSVPSEKYWVGNFAIIRDTLCPAVLTENLFMDNKEDAEYLKSEAGKEAIANLHVDALLEYIKTA